MPSGSGYIPPAPGVSRRYSPSGELVRETTNPSLLFDPGELDQMARDAAALEAAKARRDGSTRTGQENSSAQAGPLTGPQRAMALGDPIPVVFARRRTGGTGGVLVLPRATEAQFSSDGANLTVRYHCILSDGEVGSVQTRDVRKGTVREGEFSQNYDKRAGQWSPGNRLANLPGINASDYPLQCGIGGDYKGVTTIEFSSTHPITSNRWRQTWSVFVRAGLQLTRIFDNTLGASDNIVDLIRWALINSGRLTAAEIDTAQMLKAATFIEQNQLYCNGVFDNQTSLPDFLLGILPAFLLRETTIDGKFALAPLPPTNDDGTLITGPISPDWILAEEAILPDSFEISPAGAATTMPLELAVGWRQQTSDVHPPLDRELLVGVSTDTLPAREEWDLKGVCTSEAHAALVGGWRHAARTIGAATARVTVARGSHTGYIRQGQVVHIYLQVVTELEQPGAISGYWFVEQVSLTPGGAETLDLSACPVDAQGRFLLTLRALEFQAAAPGAILPYPEIGVDDEPGRAADTTVPPSTTSGTPFTAGGGGIVGNNPSSFNRAEAPPSGPPSTPPDPPTDAGGPIIETGEPISPVAEGGKDPKEPEEKKGGDYVREWVTIALTSGDGNEICSDGFDVTQMTAKGLVGGLGAPAVVTLAEPVFPPIVKRVMTEAEVVLGGGSTSFVDNGVTYYVTWYEINYKRAVAIVDGSGATIGYDVLPSTTMLGDTTWVAPSGTSGALEITFEDLSCIDRDNPGGIEE